MADLLNVEHLSVSFFTPAGEVQAVRDVSFSLKAGEVLAIVGESGCGKSVLCKSILRLLPQTAKIKSGKIIVDGTDITAYREREMTALRGSLFSMVFQDPMTALDPTMTIGVQIAEAVLAHKPKLEKSAVRARVIELLELVGIDRAQERMALYESARYKDYNLLMLLSLLSGALVILCSIIAQTINEQIDPRIRAEQAVREAEVQP